ncbi:MAG: ATP-binding protein, partial [Azoarcus sp.]|nr:ATP-binding protein [Azoarcus sp.]
MKQATQQIISAVNERRFLEHLRSFFSTSTTVLAECMQNARRAGATQVSFAYEASAATLIVTDDGQGIDDFAALVTVAESGWTQETMEDEKPFGIGFFSVCFAAGRIRVESRDKRVEFSSDDLIAKTPIAIQAGDFIDGARVTLLGCKIDEEKIADALTRYASGFSIPVIWQEIPLYRPCARAGLVGKETAAGLIHVPGIHGDQDSPLFEERGYAYCQGLPVFIPNFSYSYPPSNSRDYLVVHVDHLKYTPRMPDRDTLIDAQQAAADIDNAIKQIWRA